MSPACVKPSARDRDAGAGGLSLEVRSSNLTDHVAATLGRAIVSGDYAPGAVFQVSDLCKTFNASRTVMREAVKALTAKGLVMSSASIASIGSIGSIVRDEAALRISIRVTNRQKSVAVASAVDHARIADAIRAGDADGARQAVLTLLVEARRLLKEPIPPANPDRHVEPHLDRRGAAQSGVRSRTNWRRSATTASSARTASAG